MKKIYIICAVRNALPGVRAALEAYTDILEESGHIVHLPHRDTKQDNSGLEICMENGAAIHMSDEVHVFWDKNSSGSHFDLGMAFMLDMLVGHKKKVVLLRYNGVGQSELSEGKSFHRMITEWVREQEKSGLYDAETDNIIDAYSI